MLDRWNGQFFSGVRQRQNLPALSGENAGLFWLSPAAPLGLPAPQMTVVEDRREGSKRMLTLEVKSLRAAPSFLLALEGTTVLTSTINGRSLGETPRAAWGMRVSGMHDQTLQLHFEVEAGKPFRLRMRERSFGLPPNAFAPLPAGFMHQPFGSSGSTQSVHVLEFKN